MSYLPASIPLNGTYETQFVVGGGGSSGTISINAGVDTLAYVKIGNFVHIQGFLQIGSVSAPSGDMRMLLPYNTGAIVNFANNGVPSWYTTGMTGGGGVSAGLHPLVVGALDNYVELQIVGDTSIADRASAGANIYMSFGYYTEDNTLNP